VTGGWLPQTAGSVGLNGGGTAAAVPRSYRRVLCVDYLWCTVVQAICGSYVWLTDADKGAIGKSAQYRDNTRLWWSNRLKQRLRRNQLPGSLRVHMRFGRRTNDKPDVSGKQFKQFLRFGR